MVVVEGLLRVFSARNWASSAKERRGREDCMSVEDDERDKKRDRIFENVKSL